MDCHCYLNNKLEQIAEKTPSVPYNMLVKDAFLLLMQNDSVSLQPVVDEQDRVLGQIHRKRFIENVILSKYGYGIHLYGHKRLIDVMEKPEVLFPAYLTLEESALRVQKKSEEYFYDDIIVVKDHDKYFGTVSVKKLLEALTLRSLMLARDENPLTCLPGNWAIKRYIDEKISKNEKFDVIYIDLNNFKPFNDYYGFAKGDEVIVSLGEILKRIRKKYGCFVGHIGGDDFVVVCKPELSYKVSSEILEEFEKLLPYFHGEDYQKGFYISNNRKGEVQTFPLISISLAITGTSTRRIDSYAHLASIASEVKSMAKQVAKTTGKSAIFKDRRMDASSVLKSYHRSDSVWIEGSLKSTEINWE
jgi:GGDEF domain-containing protein